jgi:hypothetical protein
MKEVNVRQLLLRMKDRDETAFTELYEETRDDVFRMVALLIPNPNNPIMRDLLTPEEYDAYIEATMKRESMMAKGNVNPSNGPVKAEDLPVEYREAYTKSVQLIRGYEKKARQSAPENKAPEGAS